MIETNKLCKSFDGKDALRSISLSINDGEITGIVGTNGAGKSTLLRLMSGVLKPDSGTVTIDKASVWDNPKVKGEFVFLSDDPYFLPNADALRMADYFRSLYSGFDSERFSKLIKAFDLNPKQKISTFSKGMKRQLAILLAVSANTKYVFLDETFDGLDPVMRAAVKSLFADEMSQRGLTPVISSHSLRELEDICDHVGLLHKGGLLLSEQLDEMKTGLMKLQCVFSDEDSKGEAARQLKILSDERQGRLHVMTVRGTREEVMEVFSHIDTVFFEILPLTLEELFIAETEEAGYDVRKLIIS
ncbi:MAG: ABC transporter ATP-binding protein [Candidatus Weimeria sp.]